MKYIDADKLIAEIDSRMEDCKLPDGKFPTTTNIVRYEELSCLRNFITSLQQEQQEVDLEAEINKMIRSVFYDLNGIAIAGSSEYADVEAMVYIARYFYELGLNSKK